MAAPTSFSDLSTTAASNYPSGSDNVFPSLDDTLRVHAACLASIMANSGNSWVSPYLAAAGALVWNEAGADVDARFEGDTDANLLYLDAGNDRVGIGTASPAYKLSVNGAVGTAVVSGAAFVATASTGTNRVYAAFTNDGGSFYVGAESSAGGAIVSGSSAYALVINTTAPRAIQFGTNDTLRLTIDSSGNVGIGTASPSYSVDVGAGTSQKVLRMNGGNTNSGDGAAVFLSANGSTRMSIGNSSAMFNTAYDAAASIWAASSLKVFVAGATSNPQMVLDSSGNLIHTVTGTAPTLTVNATMSFELTSNTSLKIVVRGSDGVTRSTSLTLS